MGCGWIQLFQHGKTESRCFSRSCLGQANKIPITCKQVRNGLCLNVGRSFETERGDGFEYGGGEPQVFK